jgi:hypothetical protein
MFSWSISAVFRSMTLRPSTVPRTPIPLADSNEAGVEKGSSRWRASATMACANGCSLPWSMLAAQRSTASSVKPGAAAALRNAALLSVRVPVLSTTSVSTFFSASMAPASRNRMPAVAARPVAATIDIGVAKLWAHGQAMMSTATAFNRPD